MSKNRLQNLRQSFLGKSRKARSRKIGHARGRTLNMESLEQRQMFSITPLQSMSLAGNAADKPQSKMFEYAGQWWTVMPNKLGTYIYRLDGTTWTQTQKISANKGVHADVKLDGDMAYVLLFSGTKSQVAQLEYNAADNQFEAWSQQPSLVNVTLSSGVESATIERDSTGRLWIVSDGKTSVEVRYSDGLHTAWSAPITLATGISTDDISSIIAMPNHTVGVFWSDQSTKRFGFRVHQDGADPTQWSANEVPGSQSALNVGHGMADDHMHLAVTSNGTLYAAVKTSYDSSGYAKIGLLVRRPNGTWDNFYTVSGSGTRPVLAVDEAANQLIIAYTAGDHSANIVYNTSPLDNISLSPQKVLIAGSLNNVTTAKVTSTNQIAFLADGQSVLYTFDAPAPVVTSAPASGASVVAATSTTTPKNDAEALLGGQWVLNSTFSDEFNGTSLDEAKWDTQYKNWTGAGTGVFDSSNVSVANGNLQLDVNMPPAGTLPTGAQYTTATVNTTGGDPGSTARNILYGYFEVRAKAMNANTSSSFWLFNNTPEQWTEIDVAELAGSLPRQMPTNVHDIRENGQPVVPGGSLQSPQIVKFDDANVPAGQTQDNSFHTYGLDWNADTINWYLDGKLVRSIANDRWHQAQQVNLTNQVPSWGAAPTANDLAIADPFTVDYIRVYQKAPIVSGNPPVGATI
jgi:beta-glucanase (GH16 family)